MPRTSSFSGSTASSISMPTPAAIAISFSAAASPPRVASRAARVPGAASITAAIRCPRLRQSDCRSVASAMSPRAARIAAP